MKTLAKAYIEFQCELMEKGVRRDEDFYSICRRIGVSPSDLGGLLEEELGAGGDEIVYNFANGRKFF